MKAAKSVLRKLEEEITGKCRVRCPAYSARRISLPEVGTIPESVDWSKLGLVPHVNQGNKRDCYVAAPLWNLQMFAKILNRRFYPSFEELKNCDFRHFAKTSDGIDPEKGGSDPRLCMQYCMRNGVFSPKKGDRNIYKCHHGNAPLSGYARIFPFREDVLLRAIAQQPVLVSMKIGPKFRRYTKGYYREVDQKGLMMYEECHLVNAIGYDQTSIKFKNSYREEWGEEDCTFKVERDSGSLFGEHDIHVQALIPVMDTDITDFTALLQYANMNIQQDDICYCPKDMDSILQNPHWPPEIKEKIREALRKK